MTTDRSPATRALTALRKAFHAEKQALQHYRDAQANTAAAIAAARTEDATWVDVCTQMGGITRQAAVRRMNSHLHPDGRRRNLAVSPAASRLGRAELKPEILDAFPTIRAWWVHSTVREALDEVCGVVSTDARRHALEQGRTPAEAMTAAADAAHTATVAALVALHQHQQQHPDAIVSDGTVAEVAAEAARNSATPH